jgi:hypothetical protein
MTSNSSVSISDLRLDGFTDLCLFRRLELLSAAEYIRVTGRETINQDMNGIYHKQTQLHSGR